MFLLVANANADANRHVHFSIPAARVNLHPFIPQSDDTLARLMRHDKAQNLAEKLLDARLGENARNHLDALVPLVVVKCRLRGSLRLFQGVSIQRLTMPVDARARLLLLVCPFKRRKHLVADERNLECAKLSDARANNRARCSRLQIL